MLLCGVLDGTNKAEIRETDKEHIEKAGEENQNATTIIDLS